jgi:hypothetical protein
MPNAGDELRPANSHPATHNEAFSQPDQSTSAAELGCPAPPFLNAVNILSEKSRGDKTAIELFIASVRDWEARLRRRMERG